MEVGATQHSVAGRRSVLAVIPARGGSKSIPRKNVRPFLGRPLIEWTIDAALRSGSFERVLVSTDDEETAAIAARVGAEAPYLRPVELAADATPTAPVVRHAIAWLEQHQRWRCGYVAVLEPTSPGRQPFHIREATAVLTAGKADSVASIARVPHHYVPEKVLQRSLDGSISGVGGRHVRDMVHRRQDLPAYFAFDGLYFGCRADVVLSDPPTLWGDRVDGYVVEARFCVDLDEPEDWEPAERRLRDILLEGAS